MFAQLGQHIFQGLKSPNSLSEQGAVKFGRISLINGKDVLQYTGVELSEIALSVLYSIEYCTPATEIKALQKSMQTAEVLPFIMGDGSVVGKFVITDIDVNAGQYSPKGVLEMASVNLSLLEYPNDKEPKAQGIAVISKNSLSAIKVPAAVKPTSPIPSPASSITASISEGKNAVNKMKDVGVKVKKGTMSLKKGVRDVRKFADAAKQAYTTAKTKVEATKKIIQRAAELPTSLGGAIKYAENLVKLDEVADVSVLQINIDEMVKKADKVNIIATPVVCFVASKEGGK